MKREWNKREIKERRKSGEKKRREGERKAIERMRGEK
jgi:hypothetical protein